MREKDRLRPCAAARAFSATEKGKAITSRRQATRLAAPRRHTVMSVAADLHRLPLLSAPPPKGRGRNSSRVIIVFGIIPCPRRFVNRADLFCGGWARSALGGFAALLSAALFFAETLPLGGGASRMRRVALFLAKGLSTPRRVRRAAPSRHTRRPFAAAARACRARRSFPLPAR